MGALKTDTRWPAQKEAPLAMSRLVNPLILLIAGTRFFPFYGVIHHRGRRSGKSYRTPVVVAATGQGLIVPMPWGENTDWYRNVRAAGECVIRWKGRDYPVVQPEVVDAAAVQTAFGAVARAVMKRTQCLRPRHRDTTVNAI